MDSVELVFAHKPRQGEVAELEQKGDVLVLHDSDGAVVTQVNGADAILPKRLRPCAKRGNETCCLALERCCWVALLRP